MTHHFATAIILAAGKGTRMKSELPKCAHKVAGTPMVLHAGNALLEAGVQYPICVVGHQADQLIEILDENYRTAYQKEQLGTGHAVLMTEELLKNHEGPIIVVPGDAPLIQKELIQNLLEVHQKGGYALTLATCILDQSYGYGRILRDQNGTPCKIIEEKDATPEIREIKEVCTSIYCFSGKHLFQLLHQIDSNNAQQEYYLTDTLKLAYAQGLKIGALKFEDASMLYGVNDRYQLAQASKMLYERILKQHALNGVTILDPTTTYIDQEVTIEPDAVIHPLTTLSGRTSIGAGAQIGPYTKIQDCKIGSNTEILMSHLNRAEVKEGCRVGPFANIRPYAVLHQDVKVGNFVEVKNAQIHHGSSISHLSYIGDATIGKNTNIGAGTITCNYDGFDKHQTIIGEGCFVGSNTTLVAPVTVEDGSLIAAGSVITKNVPKDALAIAREKQENKQEWAKQWRNKKSKKVL